MKKLFLVAAVSTLCVSAAQAAPTIYGKLNVAAASSDAYYVDPVTGKTDKTQVRTVAQVDSYASRFGIKGKEKLTDNLNAIYGIEWEVNATGGSNADGTDGTDLNQRNRFVGLSYEGVGAIKVGKMDTHLKAAQGKVDIFKDMLADHKVIMAGENRPNNVISLESDPAALQGLGFNVMLIQAENTKLAGDNSESIKRNLGSAVSGSITYENKDLGLYGALAADQNVVSKFAANGKSAEAQAFRAVGGLNAGELVDALQGLNVSVLLQTAQPVHLSAKAKATGGDFHNFDREDSYLVSAGYAIPETAITVKGEFGQSKTQFTGTDKDVTLSVYGVMADYKFNSKTRSYVFWSQMTDDRKVGTKDIADRNTAGVGLEYNF